jgi:hypothetical protein
MGKALLPFTAFDNFSRQSASGWGTSTSGQGWSTKTASNFTVNQSNGVGVIKSVTSTDTKPRTITWQTDSKTSTQSMLFSFNPVTWGRNGSCDFGPIILYKSADEYVTLRIQPGFDTVSLHRRKPGDKDIIGLSPVKGTNIKPQAGFDFRYVYRFVQNQWYWCRVEYDDKTQEIKYRIWKNGEDEPTRWASVFRFSGADSRVPWRRGIPGFMCFGTNTFTVNIRSAYFYAGASPNYTSDGWAPDVTGNGSYPFTDTFSRVERQGFGKAENGPLWYGSVIENPNVNLPSGVGTTDAGSAFLAFTKAYANNGGYWAFVGNTLTGDKQVEVTTQFKTSTLNDRAVLRIGPRGREGVHDEKIAGVGFALAIPLKKDSTISLVRRRTLSAASWEALGAANSDIVTKPVTLEENTAYTARIHIKPSSSAGYELRAKLWKSSQTEPETFDLIYTHDVSPFITKGSPFLNASSTGTSTIEILDFNVTNVVTPPVVVPPTNTFTVLSGVAKAIYPTSAEIEFRYDGSATSETQAFIEYFAADNPAERFTLSTVSGGVDRPKNGVFRPTGGSITGLRPDTMYEVIGRLEQPGLPSSNVSFTFSTRFDGVWISDIRTHSISTNEFTTALILREDLTVSSLSNTVAYVRYRETSLVTSFPWSTEFPMTKVMVKGSDNYAGYGAPNFWLKVGGLNPDKTYEYQVRVLDPDGVDGDVDKTQDIISKLVTTFGRKVAMEWVDPSTGLKQPQPIQIVPEVTTAKVRIYYKWDIDDEVRFILDYHEIGIPFTTKYQDDNRKFLKNTSNISRKFWEARLTGLLPGMDYVVTIKVIHPVGTVEGQEEYTLYFSTRRQSPIQTKEGKHFVYKVYDREGKFLNTLPDAGEPNFGLHENGGVSDMTIKLPRTADNAGSDDAITLGNRVDVWVIDHTSDGIGRNLVVDSDFNLGGWTTSPEWSVYPTNGIDNGACLQVRGNSTGSYALSEFVTPANTGEKTKPYNMVISVDNVLDQFEEEIVSTEVSYSKTQRKVLTALRNLFGKDFEGSSLDKVLSPQIDKITNQNYGLLKKARDYRNTKFLDNVSLSVSTESIDELLDIKDEVERQGCQVSINEETETDSVPYVLMLAARALKGQITAQIEYIDVIDPNTGFISTLVSEESVSTYGTNWQVLKMLFTPPRGTRLMRIRLTAQGDTSGAVDKVQLMPQELLIYRGRIETVKTSIDGDGESIQLEVMGLVAQLTDYYVQFKQWVDRQPAKDQPKLVDLSVVEDESPPPTWVADSDLVKFRQANTPENRHAILFPEISATGVSLRVYYDGDDNNNADCTVYYTPNMNSVMTNRVFTAVEVNQIIYSIEPVRMFTEAGGSTLVDRFEQGAEFKVLSATLSSPSGSLYKWVRVQSVKDSTKSGWVQFESMTDVRGSRAGGVSAVVLSRSRIPPKTPNTNKSGSGGSGSGGSGGAGGGGNNNSGGTAPTNLGVSSNGVNTNYGWNYYGYQYANLVSRLNYLRDRRSKLITERTALQNRLNGYGLNVGPQLINDTLKRIGQINTEIGRIDNEIGLVNREINRQFSGAPPGDPRYSGPQ